MPPPTECGSCHAVLDAPAGPRCPSCGNATPSPRLRLLVALALCAGSLAFFFASVPGLAVLTKPVALVALGLGAAAWTAAHREQQPAGKAAGVTALAVAVLLFA